MPHLRNGRKNKQGRFTKKHHFPKHVLRNYVCSPQAGTCEPIKDVISHYKLQFEKRYSDHAGSALQSDERTIRALLWLFEDVYESGCVWYPRDRWRTAWQITMSVGRQLLGGRVNDFKHQLYAETHDLRNPSSNHEAMK